MSVLEQIPKVNIQAFVALLLFALSLFISRLVAKISRGELPGSVGWVFYLRMILGFVFAASIALGIYSFMGVTVLFD